MNNINIISSLIVLTGQASVEISTTLAYGFSLSDEMLSVDPTLTSYIQLKSAPLSGDLNLMPLNELDSLKVDRTSLKPGTIRIVDITRSEYGSISLLSSFYDEALSSSKNVYVSAECIGILPVMTTPLNAIYYQGLMASSSKLSNMQLLSGFHLFGKSEPFNLGDNYVIPFGSPVLDDDSISKYSASAFPLFNYVDYEYFDREHLKDVGLVVFKAFSDSANDGKMNYLPVESFIGSLDKDAKDRMTGGSKFIDDIVHSSSQYVNLFSNIDCSSKAY